MFREALRYPTRGEHAEERLLAGVVLAVAAGLLARLGVLAVLAAIPAAVLAGYATAVLRTSADTERPPEERRFEGPPAFADGRALAADGLRALAVTVGYLALPVAVLLVTLGGRVGGGAPTFGRTLSLFGAGTVALVLWLGAAYFLPAAVAGVARRGSVRAAVDRAALARTARDAGYFVGWIRALVVGAVAAALAAALAALGRPGQLLALALCFYALVVVARLLGRAMAE